MKVKKITTKMYICEVCGAEYEDDEKAARKCEKLPVEEQAFINGDMAVMTNTGEIVEVVSVEMSSPINNDELTARLGISQKSHFYFYTVKNKRCGGIATVQVKFLRKI